MGPVGWHLGRGCVWPAFGSSLDGVGMVGMGVPWIPGCKSMLSLRPQGHPGEKVIVRCGSTQIWGTTGGVECIFQPAAPHPQAGVVALFLPGLGDSLRTDTPWAWVLHLSPVLVNQSLARWVSWGLFWGAGALSTHSAAPLAVQPRLGAEPLGRWRQGCSLLSEFGSLLSTSAEVAVVRVTAGEGAGGLGVTGSGCSHLRGYFWVLISGTSLCPLLGPLLGASNSAPEPPCAFLCHDLPLSVPRFPVCHPPWPGPPQPVPV